eukprot:GHVT01032873.1.p2 GENE.GHVT01032873.1~~GHVT01032873.1.p2  ORF type:complete len:131 (-),score=10.86 GHVT01032873.1:2948-3340(-)
MCSKQSHSVSTMPFAPVVTRARRRIETQVQHATSTRDSTVLQPDGDSSLRQVVAKELQVLPRRKTVQQRSEPGSSASCAGPLLKVRRTRPVTAAVGMKDAAERNEYWWPLSRGCIYSSFGWPLLWVSAGQ